MGRMCSDPELRQTQSGIQTCRFTVAVNRRFKDKSSGETKADFISCQAWRQTAEFICKYFSKGNMIGRVPVLREYHMLEFLSQLIDQWNNLITVCNSQMPVWCKSILNIDYNQCAMLQMHFYFPQDSGMPRFQPILYKTKPELHGLTRSFC